MRLWKAKMVKTDEEQDQDHKKGGSEKNPRVPISRESPGVLQKNKEDIQTPATGQSWTLSSVAFQSFNLSLWLSLEAWLENRTRQQTTWNKEDLESSSVAFV